LTKPIRQSELLDAIASAMGVTTGATESARNRAQHKFEKSSRSLRLLLAEDNEVNQKLAVRLLEKRGHSVVVCGTGREALATIEREPFDVVLLDVQMPEMDGLETTLTIRRRERETGGHTPIVAMTAHAMKGDREQCLAAGMDAYISKPLQPDELFEVVEHLANGTAPTSSEASLSNGGKHLLNEEQALERVGGDRAFLDELISIFNRECPKWLAEIDTAIDARDAVRLHRVAHTLKGAAANLGMESARDAALALEVAEPSVDWTRYHAIAANLHTIADELQKVHRVHNGHSSAEPAKPR
jgi:CheY-like chemotaxis protein/HPt (histidine-containing phosphotransfer) domain-containing protein